MAAAAMITCEVECTGLAPFVMKKLMRSIGGNVYIRRLVIANGDGVTGGTGVDIPAGGTKWTVIVKNTGNSNLLVRYERPSDSTTFTGFTAQVQNDALQPQSSVDDQGDICIIPGVSGNPSTLSDEIVIHSQSVNSGKATVWMVRTE